MLFIAFLRGINVGGHKTIKMAELRSLLENQGCTKVRTYIQSGNIVFDQSVELITEEMFKNLLLEHFGFDIAVIILTADKLKEILRDFPFGDDHPDTVGNKTVFTFINTAIDTAENEVSDEINMLKKFVGSSEKLVYSKQGYWLYCPEGYGKTKLSNALIEKKLKLSATTRNLRTLKAMVLLTEET
jgi:uncharacterized protein (DUF1697 family)